jgi:hypothetical protein
MITFAVHWGLWWMSFAWGHGEGGTAKVGPQYAVISIREGGQFEISNEAQKWMKIVSVPMPATIPESAWVRSLTHSVFYVKREGFWKSLYSEKERKPGDELAVENVGVLRATELELGIENEQEGHEHTHE